MNKKVWLLVFMFMLVIDVKALSFKGGDVIKNVFVLKVKENGEKEYKKGQFIIDSEGDYVYCLEPFVKVNNNSSYNKYTNNFAKYLGLSDELWEKINLISYYGYQYKDDTHNKYHLYFFGKENVLKITKRYVIFSHIIMLY